jgi:hypothetical protein
MTVTSRFSQRSTRSTLSRTTMSSKVDASLRHPLPTIVSSKLECPSSSTKHTAPPQHLQQKSSSSSDFLVTSSLLDDDLDSGCLTDCHMLSSMMILILIQPLKVTLHTPFPKKSRDYLLEHQSKDQPKTNDRERQQDINLFQPPSPPKNFLHELLIDI